MFWWNDIKTIKKSIIRTSCLECYSIVRPVVYYSLHFCCSVILMRWHSINWSFLEHCSLPCILSLSSWMPWFWFSSKMYCPLLFPQNVLLRFLVLEKFMVGASVGEDCLENTWNFGHDWSNRLRNSFIFIRDGVKGKETLDMKSLVVIWSQQNAHHLRPV